MSIETLLLPELKNVSKKHRKAASDSCGGETLVDIHDYMGGLRYEPSNVVWFESMKAAESHLLSKELNDTIDGQGFLSGFILDQHYNRIGETNWDILDKIMNGK